MLAQGKYVVFKGYLATCWKSYPSCDMLCVLRASVRALPFIVMTVVSPQVHLRKLALRGTGLRAHSYPGLRLNPIESDISSELLHYKEPAGASAKGFVPMLEHRNFS